MSVVIAKKMPWKIIIWADQQITVWWWNKDVKPDNKPVKLHECNWVIFWSAWDLAESNAMRMYLEEYEPKKIVWEKSLIEFIHTFKERWKNYWVEDVSNQYIFCIWWKIFTYWEYVVEEVDTFCAIWCWAFMAMACMEMNPDVKEALKAVCKYDNFCSEPLIFKEILC